MIKKALIILSPHQERLFFPSPPFSDTTSLSRYLPSSILIFFLFPLSLSRIFLSRSLVQTLTVRIFRFFRTEVERCDRINMGRLLVCRPARTVQVFFLTFSFLPYFFLYFFSLLLHMMKQVLEQSGQSRKWVFLPGEGKELLEGRKEGKSDLEIQEGNV